MSNVKKLANSEKNRRGAKRNFKEKIVGQSFSLERDANSALTAFIKEVKDWWFEVFEALTKHAKKKASGPGKFKLKTSEIK